jgi:hypothetical protein
MASSGLSILILTETSFDEPKVEVEKVKNKAKRIRIN